MVNQKRLLMLIVFSIQIGMENVNITSQIYLRRLRNIVMGKQKSPTCNKQNGFEMSTDTRVLGAGNINK